jgi:hypothetical protein
VNFRPACVHEEVAWPTVILTAPKYPDDLEAIMSFDAALHAEPALADLAQHMTHWRAHRLSTAEPIPEALWERAVA